MGVFAHFLNSKTPQLENFEGIQKVGFQLNKKLNSNEKFRRYEITVFHIEHFYRKGILPLKAVISVPREVNMLDFNHHYQTDLYLHKVTSPKNDFQFDYARYLSRKKIFYQGIVSHALFVSPKRKISFEDKIRQKRWEVLQHIDQTTLNVNVKEFLKGIILSDRTEMGEVVVQDFSKSGLMHFLAISGTHFAVIFWMLLSLLKPLFSVKYRNIPLVVSLVLLWTFAIFIDYGSSVVRSCLMISAYYGFVLLHRKPDLLHALSMAGLFILIGDTQQLFDMGFQLSFLAVLGIFWLNKPILNWLPKPNNKFENFLVKAVAISFSAQLATIPMVLYYFHQYALLSIVANLFILPFSEAIIVFSLLLVTLLTLNVRAEFLEEMYNFLVETLLKGIHFFAQENIFFFRHLSMSGAEVILLFGILYYLRRILENKNWHSWRGFLGLMFLFLILRTSLSWYHVEKKEVQRFESFHQTIVVQKNGTHVTFWMKKSSYQPKTLSYFVEPYLVSRRAATYQIIWLPENINQ